MLLYKRNSLAKVIKGSPTSGISRKKTLLKTYLLLNKKLKSLSTNFSWRSGINKSGKITVASKGKRIYKFSNPLINHKFLDTSLHFLYSINYSKFKRFPYALFFSSSGKYCYLATNSFSNHFFIFKTRGFSDRFSMKNPLLSYGLHFPYFPNLYYSLFRITFMSFVQKLQIRPGGSIQFSRSLGSYAVILRKNLELLSVIVKLASGVKKVFSLFSLCYISEKKKRAAHSL